MSTPQHRKLACLMFADMAAFSALAQKDEKLALQLLEEQRRLVRPILPRFEGHEIKTIGDGFLIEFASAVAAAQCAIALQGALRDRNATVPEERRFDVRIGLHVGDVVVQDEDVFGDGVNIASRVVHCAPPGGICLTEAVAHQVRNKLELPVVRHGSRRLKNIQDPVTLYRVALPWERPAATRVRLADQWRARNARLAALGGVLLLGAAIGTAWWLTQRDAAPGVTGEISSMAVLPLDNLMKDPGQDYFVEGLHDALIAELAQIGSLQVISRTSVMKYKEPGRSIPEIARELHVGAVLEGAVLRSGERMRITVQLIDAAADRHLWSRSYEREVRDVLALQSDIARQVAREIRLKLTPQEQARLVSARVVDPEAHEDYLMGRWYRDRGTREDLDKALEYFQKALAEDPTYAPAYAGIATYYSVLPFYSQIPPAEVFPRAKEAAVKALELDESLPEAHAALAYIRAYYEWDWDGAARAFRRALELSPSYADAHFSYSRFLAAQERFEEAHAAIDRAFQLDPLPLPLKANIALLSYFAGDYDRAVRELRKTLELDPQLGIGHWGLGLVYEQQGRYLEAIQEMKEAAASSASPNIKSSLGHVYASAGKRTEALAVLDTLSQRASQAYVPSYFFALVHTGLGDRDRAFEWLEKAYRERSTVLAYLLVDPRLDSLHADPRFGALARRLKFPQQGDRLADL